MQILQQSLVKYDHSLFVKLCCDVINCLKVGVILLLNQAARIQICTSSKRQVPRNDILFSGSHSLRVREYVFLQGQTADALYLTEQTNAYHLHSASKTSSSSPHHLSSNNNIRQQLCFRDIINRFNQYTLESIYIRRKWHPKKSSLYVLLRLPLLTPISIQ